MNIETKPGDIRDAFAVHPHLRVELQAAEARGDHSRVATLKSLVNCIEHGQLRNFRDAHAADSGRHIIDSQTSPVVSALDDALARAHASGDRERIKAVEDAIAVRNAAHASRSTDLERGDHQTRSQRSWRPWGIFILALVAYFAAIAAIWRIGPFAATPSATRFGESSSNEKGIYESRN